MPLDLYAAIDKLRKELEIVNEAIRVLERYRQETILPHDKPKENRPIK